MRAVADAQLADADALMPMPMPMRELNGNFDADARIGCAFLLSPVAILPSDDMF